MQQRDSAMASIVGHQRDNNGKLNNNSFLLFPFFTYYILTSTHFPIMFAVIPQSAICLTVIYRRYKSNKIARNHKLFVAER